MLREREIVVDSFAGGGGTSTGMMLGLNRHVDIAINHDPPAIDMHKLNHPETTHYCESVWDVCPEEACKGRPVGLFFCSPDCKHFSRAKGGKPVDRNIRGLAWIAIKWAALVPVRILMLENVEEFTTWGPLDESQRPCKNRKGETFDAFTKALSTGLETSHPAWKEIYQALFKNNFNLEQKLKIFKAIKNGLGYKVEWDLLRACDYGAPTIRKRLFLVARNDGERIIWPKKTHGIGRGQKPFRTAADIIDWSVPAKSIFDRKKPLAENTLKRIAKGLEKFVFNSDSPFIVPAENVAPFITEHANASSQRNMPIDEPVRTICAQVKGGHFALVTPVIDRQFGNSECNSVEQPLGAITAGGGGKSALIAPTLIQTGYGERKGQTPRALNLHKPLGTVVAGGCKHGLVTTYIAKHYTGVDGSDIQDPLHTITSKDHNALVTSHMVKFRGTNIGHPTDEPIHTISAGGNHIGEVRAFLVKYFESKSQAFNGDLLTGIASNDSLGLINIKGEVYQIVDIGMRMLEPHELFAAQGFPENYIISHNSKGEKLSKASQVARCGNAVCPPVAQALVEANLPQKQKQAA